MALRNLVSLWIGFSFSCLINVADAESPAPGKQVAMATPIRIKSIEGERETTIRYLLALPADYDKQPEQKWPLVLFLHGSGERGDDIEKVKVHGPPKLVAAGKDFPFVLVSPQCESGSHWNPQELAKLVEHAANTWRVNRQRLYVTGLSMGGLGTWSLISEFPGMFAAAIPICGRGDPAAAEKLKTTPTWIFVGAEDRAETVANCETMAAELKKAGGDVQIKVYPDLRHDCWTVTYENPEVYAWLLKQRLPAK
jgi:predicted peptidase